MHRFKQMQFQIRLHHLQWVCPNKNWLLHCLKQMWNCKLKWKNLHSNLAKKNQSYHQLAFTLRGDMAILNFYFYVRVEVAWQLFVVVSRTCFYKCKFFRISNNNFNLNVGLRVHYIFSKDYFPHWDSNLQTSFKSMGWKKQTVEPSWVANSMVVSSCCSQEKWKESELCTKNICPQGFCTVTLGVHQLIADKVESSRLSLCKRPLDHSAAKEFFCCTANDQFLNR